MTIWQTGGIWLGLMVYAVAWIGGGRPERFGAGVMLLTAMISSQSNAWEVAGYLPGFIVLAVADLAIFGWLCLRSDRWWPFVATTGFALIVLGYGLRLLDPTFRQDAMVSAKIGLLYVIDLSLLFGVWERRLSGEPPAARAAWAAAERVTAARRPAEPERRERAERKVGTHTTSRRRGKPGTR